MSDKPNNILEFINHQFASLRMQFGNALGLSHDGKRDIYSIYGYDDQVSFAQMWRYSRRHGIANRITHGMAKSCWRDGFELFDSPEGDANKVLEDEILKLNKRGLNKKIEQADILNRIGKFSVLFVGIPDGKDPSEEIGSVPGEQLDQIYFKAFAYDGITIEQQETDTKNPRFGLPKIYSVRKLAGNGDIQKDTELSAMRVHWSRIVHLNEEALDSDVEGMGQLEPIFNRILDLDKTTGGSAEAYFRNARGKIAYEIDPKFSDSLLKSPNKELFEEGAQAFNNGWKDFMVAVGAKASTIDTPHHSPKDTVMAALWEISGYTGIPIRVLIGQGSGQLAGSEDQLTYNALVSGRQKTFCAPVIVVGVLEILAKAGMLELPENYDIRFPVQQAVTEAQEAEINNKNADTIAKITAAASTQAGDEIDVTGTLKIMGLEVETDPEPRIIDDQEQDNEDAQT